MEYMITTRVKQQSFQIRTSLPPKLKNKLIEIMELSKRHESVNIIIASFLLSNSIFFNPFCSQ